MVKLLVKVSDGFLLGIGLSEANVQQIKNDKTLIVKLKEIPFLGGIKPEDIEIMIFYGETEEYMRERLQHFITPETITEAK